MYIAVGTEPAWAGRCAGRLKSATQGGNVFVMRDVNDMIGMGGIRHRMGRLGEDPGGEPGLQPDAGERIAADGAADLGPAGPFGLQRRRAQQLLVERRTKAAGRLGA